MSNGQPLDFHAEAGERAAQVINVELGKGLSVVAICSALCAISAVFAAWAVSTSLRAEKETRLTQYYLMDPHSRTPEELAAWAKFQREHEKE